MIGSMTFIYFVIFIIFVTLVIYPLGRFFTYFMRLETRTHQTILVSLILGLVAFTLESFLIGLTGLKIITPYVIYVQTAVLWAFLHKKAVITSKFPKVKLKPVALIIISLSVFLNSLITFPFGVMTDRGIRFAGVHPTDSSWHLSVINALQVSIPPENPVFSGQILKNYHYLVDLQIAGIGSLTRIPTDVLFYQIIGSFYIFLYASMAYVVGKQLTGKGFGGVLAVAFTSLSSNWYYLTNLIYPSSFHGPSVAWVDYFSSKSVSYPLLFSMIVLFLVLYLFITVKRYDKKIIIIVSVLIGSLISFKAHTAIVLFASLGSVAFIDLFKRRYYLVKIFLSSLLIGAFFLFTMFSPGSQGIIIYPLWFIKVMYEAPDRLNLSDWELRRQYLISLATPKSYLGVARLYIQGIAVFLFTNLGVLMLGPISLFKKFGKTKVVSFILLFMTFFPFVLTMLFIYKGIAIITIQFFYPAIVSLSFLLAMLLVSISKFNRLLAVVASLLIWVSLLPGVFFTLRDYSNLNSYYSPAYSEAIRFLSKEETGVVLSAPEFNSNAIVSAYSKKPTFYTDDIRALVPSDIYEQRVKQVQSFFDCGNLEAMKSLIISNNIKYVFVGTGSKCLDRLGYLNKIFDNGGVRIYKI